MRRKVRLALLFSCALVLLFSSLARRGPGASAAQATVKRETNASLLLLQQDGAGSKQQSGAQKSEPAKPIVVREIDVAGLKRLLERKGQTPPRPLLINFWATWCEPCRAEFPDLVQIDKEYRARGLDFIAVSIDEATEMTTTVPRFLQEMRAEMPAYLLNTPEPEAAIFAVDPQWSGSLPATFLYDAQGRIVFKHLGRIKPEELRAAINKVIKAVTSDK